MRSCATRREPPECRPPNRRQQVDGHYTSLANRFIPKLRESDVWPTVHPCRRLLRLANAESHHGPTTIDGAASRRSVDVAGKPQSQENVGRHLSPHGIG